MHLRFHWESLVNGCREVCLAHPSSSSHRGSARSVKWLAQLGKSMFTDNRSNTNRYNVVDLYFTTPRASSLYGQSERKSTLQAQPCGSGCLILLCNTRHTRPIGVDESPMEAL